jgi:hypothetical protein
MFALPVYPGGFTNSRVRECNLLSQRVMVLCRSKSSITTFIFGFERLSSHHWAVGIDCDRYFPASLGEGLNPIPNDCGGSTLKEGLDGCR